MPTSELVGKIGRVSGLIAPGTTGEVILDINPGTSTFFAYPADGTSVFELHEMVQVVSFSPPMSVYVRGSVQDA